MATAKKLPSGRWRCLVYAGNDATGKRIYESFTADSKKAAQLAAAQWEQERKRRPEDLTVTEACKKYIEAKTGVLSPSTLRVYTAMLPALGALGEMSLRALDSYKVQRWITEQAQTVSAKTVKNRYSFFLASVSMFGDFRFDVSLPVVPRLEYDLPTDEDIKAVLAYCSPSGTKPCMDLWIALQLSRNHSLRRSEMCGLSRSDLKGNLLHVHNVVVRSSDGWTQKDIPKTDVSNRYVMLSEPLLGVLKQFDDKFISLSPGALADRLRRAIAGVNRANPERRIKEFTFHDLRHSFAAHAALLGVPDVYTAKLGGWSPASPIMKNVYQNTFRDELKKQAEKLNSSGI